MTVIGWDIGGVNIKAARVHANAPLAARNDPFEIQRAPATLAARLEGIATALGAEKADVHAITMTAELSQFFRTKRDGVVYVLDAVERAFPAAHTFAYTVDGRFLDPAAARQSPLLVAASIANVRERHPKLETAVIAGHGAFLARAAARRAGLRIAHDDLITAGEPRAAGAEAAFAVARLLERWLSSTS